MKNMIQGGADVNLPTQRGGETALILAAERGLYHCTKALLEANADTRLVAKVISSMSLYVCMKLASMLLIYVYVYVYVYILTCRVIDSKDLMEGNQH